MTDYLQGTGSGGQMMIRDLGNEVQFWIRAGSSVTNVAGLYVSWSSSAGSYYGATDYPAGGNWHYVVSIYVTTSQTIRFSIGASGTSGLGGPTDFYQAITRGTIPAAPASQSISPIGYRTMQYNINDGSNGGLAITSRQYQMATSSGGVPGASIQTMPLTIGSGGGVAPTGLLPGTEYFFRGRTVNSAGAGPWSAITSARTKYGLRRWDNGAGAEVACAAQKRWDNALATEVDLTVFKRWDATAGVEVDLT